MDISTTGTPPTTTSTRTVTTIGPGPQPPPSTSTTITPSSGAQTAVTTIHSSPQSPPESLYPPPRTYHHTSFIIAIIFLIIGIAMVIITVFYFLFWRPTITGPTCDTNTNCSIDQICQMGSCVEKLCSSNSDCTGNGICLLTSVNSYCYNYSCNIGNDCPNGTACISGSCVSIGSTCSSNSDCPQLSCMNGRCQQCNQNSQCPLGQGCFNSVCRYPYEGETGSNMINFYSPAQINGNISAPPGYFCRAGGFCGLTGTQQTPIPCGTTGSLCPNNCSYCVNGTCRCTPGVLFEGCSGNSDCASKLCSDNICVPSEGDCVYNYDGSGNPGVCNASKPYCVNGTCSNLSLGAMCGTGPVTLCSNPINIGGVGTPGITSAGMGFFCVNGFCQDTPGTLNDLCSDNSSCEYIQNGVLVCAPVTTPNIIQMRCLAST